MLRKMLGVIIMVLSTQAIAGEGKAIFAGGCFWCMQSDFDKVPGVTKTIVGYTGGELENPTYKQVGTQSTGHYEAIEILYDDNTVSYSELLEIFWKNVDPVDADGQFCDRGSSYRAAIFYLDDTQKVAAEKSKEALLTSGKVADVVTPILPASTFYPAEGYHQSYYKKNPVRYKFYRYSCGRDKRLKDLWG